MGTSNLNGQVNKNLVVLSQPRSRLEDMATRRKGLHTSNVSDYS